MTDEEKQFWEAALEARQEVASWPAWKKAAAARARVSDPGRKSRLTTDFSTFGRFIPRQGHCTCPGHGTSCTVSHEKRSSQRDAGNRRQRRAEKRFARDAARAGGED